GCLIPPLRGCAVGTAPGPRGAAPDPGALLLTPGALPRTALSRLSGLPTALPRRDPGPSGQPPPDPESGIRYSAPSPPLRKRGRKRRPRTLRLQRTNRP